MLVLGLPLWLLLHIRHLVGVPLLMMICLMLMLILCRLLLVFRELPIDSMVSLARCRRVAARLASLTVAGPTYVDFGDRGQSEILVDEQLVSARTSRLLLAWRAVLVEIRW